MYTKTFHLFYLTCDFPSMGLQWGGSFKILSGSTLISITTTIRKKMLQTAHFLFMYVNIPYHNMTIPICFWICRFLSMTIQFSTYMFSPRGWPQYGCFCERNIQLPRYADPSTILASTTCPQPDFVLSNRAIIIPRAQSKPPPPKSAARLSGAVGFSFLRPRHDNKPKRN